MCETGVQVKACTACGDVKAIAEFNRHKGRKDGRNNICKICKRKLDAEYRIKNPNKNKEDYAVRISDNPNYWADRYAANRDFELARVSQWQKDNPEKRREMHKKFRANNPDYYKDWPKRDVKKTKLKRDKHYAKKKDDPAWKVENSFKVGVYKSLKDQKAGRSWEKLVGYSVKDLMAHLESNFLPGMSWQNYGLNGWHIDHIIPRSVFNYEVPEDIDFQKCWSLDNLRPLWAADNIRKGAKLEVPFQPSLALAVNDNQPHHQHEEITDGITR